jgi:hypothetical protein
LNYTSNVWHEGLGGPTLAGAANYTAGAWSSTKQTVTDAPRASYKWLKGGWSTNSTSDSDRSLSNETTSFARFERNAGAGYKSAKKSVGEGYKSAKRSAGEGYNSVKGSISNGVAKARAKVMGASAEEEAKQPSSSEQARPTAFYAFLGLSFIAFFVGTAWFAAGMTMPSMKDMKRYRRDRKYASMRANGKHVDTVEIGAVGLNTGNEFGMGLGLGLDVSEEFGTSSERHLMGDQYDPFITDPFITDPFPPPPDMDDARL